MKTRVFKVALEVICITLAAGLLGFLAALSIDVGLAQGGYVSERWVANGAIKPKWWFLAGFSAWWLLRSWGWFSGVLGLASALVGGYIGQLLRTGRINPFGGWSRISNLK